MENPLEETKQKKPWLKIVSNKYLLISLLFGVWMLFLDNYSYMDQRQLNKQIDELEQTNYDELIMEELISKLKEVSVTKYETLKCPKVGDNEETVIYFINNMYPYNKIRYNTNILTSLNECKNQYIPQLSPEFNKISNHTSGIVTSVFDFRGEVIANNNLLSKELKIEAYQNKNPEKMKIYADKLENYIQIYNDDEMNEDQKTSYKLIKEGIYWLRFWAERDHGINAWY
jgi:hypothetical protein